jgi:hypothetical protein
MMDKKDIKEFILKLVNEIEEEDIGISLFTTFYRNEDELSFFNSVHRERVLKIFKAVSEDSIRHKKIIKTIIGEMEKKL